MHRSSSTIRSTVEWLIAGLLAGTIGLLIVQWFTAHELDATRPPPIAMSLRGDAAAMGRQHGKQEARTVKALMDRYLRGRICGRDAALFDRRGQAALAALPADSPYTHELHALADAAGVPASQLAYGNAFVDMGDAAVGCRSLVMTTPDGLLHAHNLDWDTLAGLGTWSVSIIRRFPDDDRLATVSIGFPGLVGTVDVINERGIALSYNLLERGHAVPSEPLWIGIRRIAETCSDFASASQAVRELPAGMGFFITISDARSGQATVIERDAAGRLVERPLQDGRIFANNTAVDHGKSDTAFSQVVRQQPASLTGVQAVLRHPDVMAGNNLYSVIWDYSGNRLYLASGVLPAAKSPYREFPLFAPE